MIVVKIYVRWWHQLLIRRRQELVIWQSKCWLILCVQVVGTVKISLCTIIGSWIIWAIRQKVRQFNILLIPQSVVNLGDSLFFEVGSVDGFSVVVGYAGDFGGFGNRAILFVDETYQIPSLDVCDLYVLSDHLFFDWYFSIKWIQMFD